MAYTELPSGPWRFPPTVRSTLASWSAARGPAKRVACTTILRQILGWTRQTTVLLASAALALVLVAGFAEAAPPPLPEPADAPLTSPLVVPKSPEAQPTPPLPQPPSNSFSAPAEGFVASAVATTIVAGRTPATFAVSDTGAATYTIPLWAPPGVGSLQLDLSLVYSSRAPNGVLGVGWTLTGLSAITRCNKSWAQDGAPAGVTLTLADRFCLDGQQLKLTELPRLLLTPT